MTHLYQNIEPSLDSALESDVLFKGLEMSILVFKLG